VNAVRLGYSPHLGSVSVWGYCRTQLCVGVVIPQMTTSWRTWVCGHANYLKEIIIRLLKQYNEVMHQHPSIQGCSQPASHVLAHIWSTSKSHGLSFLLPLKPWLPSTSPLNPGACERTSRPVCSRAPGFSPAICSWWLETEGRRDIGLNFSLTNYGNQRQLCFAHRTY